MASNAFQVDEFPHNLHEADGRHLTALYQLIRGSVLGQHTDL